LYPWPGSSSFTSADFWIDGGGPAKIATFSSIFQWRYWRQVIGNTENSTLILIFAALFGLTLAALCASLSHSLRISTLIKCIISGAKKNILPCLTKKILCHKKTHPQFHAMSLSQIAGTENWFPFVFTLSLAGAAGGPVRGGGLLFP